MDLTQLRVLIVDDQKSMRQIVRSLLRQLEVAEITEAADGAEAYKKASADCPDLILSDWNMEPISGLLLLKKIRASKAPLKDVPFVMLTAETKKENVVAASEAGVDNYIIKPFNQATLKTKISEALAKRG